MKNPVLSRTIKILADFFSHPSYRIATTIGIIVLLFLLFFGINGNHPETSRPKYGPIIEAVYGIGTITSKNSFNLKIGITGNLEKLFVEEGDIVTKDQKLARVSGIPDFRSPFPGTVSSIRFSEGESLFPQLPILTVLDTKNIYLSVILEQDAALRVRTGQTARFSFESLRGKKFSGIVRSVYPAEGQFKVHIEVKDLPDVILPGMTADVAIEISRRENVKLIPLSSVNSGMVILYRGGRKKKTPVEIGSVDGEWAEILSGDIQDNDEIVLKKAVVP